MKSFRQFLKEMPTINAGGTVIDDPDQMFKNLTKCERSDSILLFAIYLPNDPFTEEWHDDFYHVVNGKESSVMKMKDKMGQNMEISCYHSYPKLKEIFDGNNMRAVKVKELALVFSVKPKKIRVVSNTDLMSFTSDFSEGDSYRFIFLTIGVESGMFALYQRLKNLTNDYRYKERRDRSITLEEYREFESLYKKTCEDFFKQSPEVYEAVLKKISVQYSDSSKNGEVITTIDKLTKVDVIYNNPDYSLGVHLEKNSPKSMQYALKDEIFSQIENVSKLLNQEFPEIEKQYIIRLWGDKKIKVDLYWPEEDKPTPEHNAPV